MGVKGYGTSLGRLLALAGHISRHVIVAGGAAAAMAAAALASTAT